MNNPFIPKKDRIANFIDVPKSKGIADDYSVRKNIATRNINATNANISNQIDVVTIHGTTMLIDHIGEHTGAHRVVFDNDIQRSGKLFIDHIGESTGSHKIVFDNLFEATAIKNASGKIYIGSTLGDISTWTASNSVLDIQTSRYAAAIKTTNASDINYFFLENNSGAQFFFGLNASSEPFVNTGTSPHLRVEGAYGILQDVLAGGLRLLDVSGYGGSGITFVDDANGVVATGVTGQLKDSNSNTIADLIGGVIVTTYY